MNVIILIIYYLNEWGWVVMRTCQVVVGVVKQNKHQVIALCLAFY